MFDTWLKWDTKSQRTAFESIKKIKMELMGGGWTWCHTDKYCVHAYISRDIYPWTWYHTDKYCIHAYISQDIYPWTLYHTDKYCMHAYISPRYLSLNMIPHNSSYTRVTMVTSSGKKLYQKFRYHLLWLNGWLAQFSQYAQMLPQNAIIWLISIHWYSLDSAAGIFILEPYDKFDWPNCSADGHYLIIG